MIGILLILSGRNPRYQGRSLTSWLERCSNEELTEAQRSEAEDAVRAIGAKRALPTLLRLIETREDPVRTWIMAKREQYNLKFLPELRSTKDCQQLGWAGFEVFGTNAAPALEELTRLLTDDQLAVPATACLICIGPRAESAVCEALTNKNAMVRRLATEQFAWVTDDVEDFLAHMKTCLSDPDDDIRVVAVQGIGRQTNTPDSAIPLVLAALHDEHDRVSSEAAMALASFGANALRGFTDLSNAVENASPNTSRQALTTLVAIAPDQALPVVLNNFRSADPRHRAASFQMLLKYMETNSDAQTAIQQAAADPDARLARRAKEMITVRYVSKHPIESEFSDEPSFGGKSLGEWLKMHDYNGEFSEDAKQAIRQLGTNAIPSLLKRLVYVQPPFGLPANEVNIDAIRGFIVLGEQTRPVLPQLETLMDGTNGNLALHVMLAACGTGSNAIPFLIKGLTNQFADVRNEAANYLTGGTWVLSSDQRESVIPLFLKLLNDPDEYVRVNATNELKTIAPAAAAKVGIK